jgi:hypothetical protein
MERSISCVYTFSAVGAAAAVKKTAEAKITTGAIVRKRDMNLLSR